MEDMSGQNRSHPPHTSTDFAIFDAVLKSVCRELGVERDRVAVFRISLAMTNLWQQGVRDPEQLRGMVLG
jgi:hypothetical protein